MDKEYIEHKKAFQIACKLQINEAIVSFQQGVTDYFKGEYAYIEGKHVVSNKMEERCANDEHYESGVNFADFLSRVQKVTCV